MIIIEAILKINPNANVTITDNDINQIEWLDGTTPISKADIQAKITELQTAYDNNEYQRDRASEYKELKEQLDLLYHDMTADKGDKSGEWYKHIKKVKDDNPKE
jgi:hypothetical protein